MNKNDIADNLFEAIDIILNEKLKKLQLDKTILMRIIYPVDEDGNDISENLNNTVNTRYLVQYQDNQFTVQAFGLIQYKPGQMVWVLVPQGNMENEKIIIGQIENDFIDTVLEAQFQQLDTQFKQLDSRVVKLDSGVTKLDSRVTELEKFHSNKS